MSAYHGNLHIQMNNTILNFNRAHHQGGAVYLSQYNSNYEPVHRVEITLHNITAYSNIGTHSDGGAVYIIILCIPILQKQY